MEIPKVLLEAQTTAEKKVGNRQQDIKWAESSLDRARQELFSAEKELSNINKAIAALYELGYKVEDL